MADNISYFPSSSPIQYCCPPKIGSSFPSLGSTAASFVWRTTLRLPFSYAHIISWSHGLKGMFLTPRTRSHPLWTPKAAFCWPPPGTSTTLVSYPVVRFAVESLAPWLENNPLESNSGSVLLITWNKASAGGWSLSIGSRASTPRGLVVPSSVQKPGWSLHGSGSSCEVSSLVRKTDIDPAAPARPSLAVTAFTLHPHFAWLMESFQTDFS